MGAIAAEKLCALIKEDDPEAAAVRSHRLLEWISSRERL